MSWRKKTVVNDLLILLCGICLPIVAASAAEVSTSSGVTAGMIYTDNTDLEESDKKSELAAVIRPYISLRRKSARTTLDLIAELEYNTLGSGSNTLNPRVQANANAELREDLAFIDARATASRNVIDPFSAAGSDSTDRADNQTTTYTYTLSPYITNHFESFADLLTRYSFSSVDNSDSEANDSDSHAFSMVLNSGSDFPRIPWGLIGNYRKTDYAGGSDSELISADARVGYKFTRIWQINASVGREWNDFTSTRSDVDGFRWDFHVIWTPNTRTSLDIGYGDRFFGSTPSFNFQHRSRRSVITASYSRDLTDANRVLSEQDVFEVTDALDEPIPVDERITGDPQSVSPIQTRLDDSQIVDERFIVAYSLIGRRTTLTLNGNYSKQTPQDSQGDDKFQRYGITLSRQLSRVMSADTSVNWHREEEDEENSSSNTWYFRMGLSRELNPKSSLRLAYTHADRDSDQVDDSYEENRIDFSIRVDF